MASSRIHNQPCMTHGRPQPLTHSLIHIDDSINTTVHKNSTFRFTPWIVSIFYFSIFLFFGFVIYSVVSLVLSRSFYRSPCLLLLSFYWFLSDIIFSSYQFLCASHSVAFLFRFSSLYFFFPFLISDFIWRNARCPDSAEVNLLNIFLGMNR